MTESLRVGRVCYSKAMMKKIIFAFLLLMPMSTQAQVDTNVTDEYVRAVVTEVVEEGVLSDEVGEKPYQRLRAEVKQGQYERQIVDLEQGLDFTITPHDLVDVGDEVVLVGLQSDEGVSDFYIIDHYRLPSVAVGLGVFFVLVVWIAGRKGLGSIVGLGISLVVIALYIVPQIIAGGNPLIVSLVGASLIAVISISVAHGFERRTAVALVSTIFTLALAVGIAWLYVVLAKLSGLGSENAYFLQVGDLANLDLRGLLLGGIIIGALGVLDDVTTSQAAAVEEIYKADFSVSKVELYRRSMSVGREHIAALVNTLALAYVGAAFPLFLLIASNNVQPLWVMFNSQMVIEEVIRTLVGSVALVLAVPITTLLAVVVYMKAQKS